MFILVRSECLYIQFVVAARVIYTEKFVVGGTNWRERDMSQVSDEKVERALRAQLLLSCVLCDASCVELIRPFRGCPAVGAENDQHVNICSFVVRCDQRWPSTQ